MTEWTVVGVLAALVGLVMSVAKPMLSLNASITRLTTLLNSLRDELQQISDRNARGHDRIWKKLEEQTEEMGQIEHRLTVLEEHGVRKE